jgi:hypothetical protein
MIGRGSLLITSVRLGPRARAAPPALRRRGRPRTYPDRLILKALVVMNVRPLRSPYELVTVLAQPTAEMATPRGLLLHEGQFPARPTWEWRLAASPEPLPAQIDCLGRRRAAAALANRRPPPSPPRLWTSARPIAPLILTMPFMVRRLGRQR